MEYFSVESHASDRPSHTPAHIHTLHTCTLSHKHARMQIYSPHTATRTNTLTHTRTHTHKHTHKHTHTYTHKHTNTLTHTHAQTHSHIHTRTNTLPHRALEVCKVETQVEGIIVKCMNRSAAYQPGLSSSPSPSPSPCLYCSPPVLLSFLGFYHFLHPPFFSLFLSCLYILTFLFSPSLSFSLLPPHASLLLMTSFDR